MKKIFQVVTLLLALNFLAVAGAVGWLFQSQHLDKEKALAIKLIVFPSTEPTTQPSGEEAQRSTTQPVAEFENIDDLLRRKGQPASEQVEVIQRSIDEQSAQLDRRRRELDAMAEQVAREQKRLADVGASLDQSKRQLDQREQQDLAKASDQGYQNSLKLYSSMPAAQVKKIFVDLPDDAIISYLQAMPPRAATKIIKEFKTKQELDLIHRVMEKMRTGKDDPTSGGNAMAAKTEAKGPGQPKEDNGVIGPSGTGPAASTDAGLTAPGAAP